MDAMMDGMGGGMMVWMLLWGLVGISLLVLAAVGAVAVARKRSNDQVVAAPRESDQAVVELRRRLAAGEIDEDEYLRRRSALE